MKRKDILTPIGILLGLSMIIVGILSGAGMTGFRSFLDITSFFVVTGGLLAALMVSFPFKELKNAPVILKQAFTIDDLNKYELVNHFIELSEKARRQGLLSLEPDVMEMDDRFLRKGLMLVIDGVDQNTISDILNTDIASMEERHRKGRRVFEKAGEFAPAWGMIGTLIGLVLMLNHLNTPETLGPNMAIALLTTLYGSLLANMLFLPIAAKLEEKTEEEIFMKQIMIEGIIGIQTGQNSRQLFDKLSVFVKENNKKADEEELSEDEDVLYEA
ncbi:flagellar motor protein MotP [Bacillus carboniphilus]|uniref:Flagellar motor protein MotP n=1 Tax=Bacillus carboniphilus TaxID=86663 RepID=A0ABY9K0F6_9BACI|nr:flagellar motor protein MotP [Bacillus carboniphilus]WLR44203.1 flagellar motor protein MotP [Bacillus carboniphilus]